jgi:hypothetical protein
MPPQFRLQISLSSSLQPRVCHCESIHLRYLVGREIRSHFREFVALSILVEMPVLTFRQDALLRRSDEDLGDGVEGEQHQWLERCQSIAEIHQGRDEDEKMQHERSDVAESHCGGGRN